MIDNYLLYLFISAITVASPGPGVILTLSNIIRYNFIATVSGIWGIVTGVFVIALISVTSLGIILATSAIAFSIMKFIGAAYLIYLGIKLWRAPVMPLELSTENHQQSLKNHFIEGFTVSLLNPKAIFFFMSLFPQFIELSTNYVLQFTYLTLTFCSLLIIIHLIYAVSAQTARKWLTTKKGRKNINRTSGTAFILFGVGLASAERSITS
jgi:threonine/homoserine/homoserine lactone efflux protein